MGDQINRRILLGSGMGALGAAVAGPMARGAQGPAAGQAWTLPDGRCWAKSLAQDYSVMYRREADRIDGPALARLADGLLVGVAPIRKGSGWFCEVVQSTDDGSTWSPPFASMPYCSGSLFVHEGWLCLLAFAGGHRGNLVLVRSNDGGRTWSEAVTLFKGRFWNSPTDVAFLDGRLYWAMDSFETVRGPCVVTCPVTADLMDPASWRISNDVPFPGLPDSLLNPNLQGSYPSQRMLEPNVLIVGGRIRLLAAVKPPLQATTNLAAVFDLEDDGDQLELSFTQYHPMPGGQVKFCVTWDEVSQLFWATVNLAADGQDLVSLEDPRERRGDRPYRGAIGGNDRRFLMLMYGLDGLNWFPAGCVARATRLGNSFMYPSQLIDKDDLLIVARSSLEDSENRHDARTATFHRVRNFRRLAMNLRQDIDA